ncbi:hypothetical protein HMPREF3190_00522 [Umbribacter vaginalis]|nr:hypothetical protein HMPREF3190_00522 [Coriobacteriales bacterium DNF00809]
MSKEHTNKACMKVHEQLQVKSAPSSAAQKSVPAKKAMLNVCV